MKTLHKDSQTSVYFDENFRLVIALFSLGDLNAIVVLDNVDPAVVEAVMPNIANDGDLVRFAEMHGWRVLVHRVF